MRNTSAVLIPHELLQPRIRRLLAILPLLDFREYRARHGVRPMVRAPNGEIISTMDSLAAYVAAREGVSTKTIYRWYGRFLKRGYAGLARTPRSDRGVSRFFRAHPEAANVLRKCARQKLSTTAAWKLICEELVKGGIKAPIYNTVRRSLETNPISYETVRRELGRVRAGRRKS
jgi:transposase